MNEQTRHGDWIIDEPDRFKVHRSVYTDTLTFERELRQVYYRNWVYVAHGSEIPRPGDYRTTTIGRQPVIVSRDDDGGVHVLLNRCSHRGAVVCREDRGHSNFFRCFYHNWIYDKAGKLVGTAQRSGYPDDFDHEEMSLVSAAHVVDYRGLIFAALTDDVPPFEERFDPIRPYVDDWIDRSPEGSVHVSPIAESYSYPANWKFQAENGVDGYHGNYVHESYAKILERAGERTLRDITAARGRIGAVNRAKGLATGDGLLERDSAMLGSFDTEKVPEFRQELVDAYGEERAKSILMMRNLYIFPNLYLFESHLRVLRPLGVAETVADNYFAYLDGVSDEINTARLREHERFFGSAGFGASDDVEVFVYNQTGMKAEAVEWVDLSRGLHREERNEAGEWVGHTTDEQPQRALYRRWSALMGRD